MKLRKLIKADLITLKAWWEYHLKQRHNKEIPSGYEFPSWMFSSHGYIASKQNQGEEEKDIAMLFWYPTKDSKVALVGWPISAPKSTKKERNLALNLLFDTIHKDAHDAGYQGVWSWSGVAPVQRKLDQFGYVVGDENVNTYLKGFR
jgi:hypothetical protein